MIFVGVFVIAVYASKDRPSEPKRARTLTRNSVSLRDQKALLILKAEDLTSVLVKQLVNLEKASDDALVSRRANQLSEKMYSALTKAQNKFGLKDAYKQGYVLAAIWEEWLDSMHIEADTDLKEITGKNKVVNSSKMLL